MPTFTCRNCNERWDSSTYPAGTCPNCGSVDTAPDPGCGCCSLTSMLFIVVVAIILIIFL